VIGRIAWGLFFFASGIFNALMTLPNPELYRVFSTLTFFPFYRRLLLEVALPNAYVISGLVVAFELAVGVMILARGRWVRWGLIGTGAWTLFVTPAMGWYTIWSPLLLAIPLLLLRYDYARSLLDLVLRRESGTPSG
jgi:hypothetical protein